MTKLLDQQQLSEGVRAFEEHLRRASAPDWTVDRQSAKPVNAQPARTVAGDRKAAVAGRGKPPIGHSSGKLTSRSLLLALGALVLTVFVGAMVATLPDWSALFAEKDSAAFEPETQVIAPARQQAITPAQENDAAQPVGSASSAAPSKAPLDGLAAAPAPATSEVYVSTIRPDGSLAPDTTPHVDLVAPADPTPQAAAAPPPPVSVPAPAPNSTTAPPPTAEQIGPAPAVATTTDAPSEKSPPAAKPAKKRTATRPANPAAKPIAGKSVAPSAAKPADDARQPAPAAADVDGIFQSAQRAVGSLTGTVKKLVGAD